MEDESPDTKKGLKAVEDKCLVKGLEGAVEKKKHRGYLALAVEMLLRWQQAPALSLTLPQLSG